MKKYNNWILGLVAVTAVPMAFGDTQQITIRGGDAEKVNLNSTEHHTVYRQVPVQTMCSRQEQRGFDRVCDAPVVHQVCDADPAPASRPRPEPAPAPKPKEEGGTSHGPTPGAGAPSGDHRGSGAPGKPDDGRKPSSDDAPTGGTCRDVSEPPVCRSVPHYVTVTYPCTKIETVAVGEQTDYNVSGTVTVQASEAPAGTNPNESLSLGLDGTNLTLNYGGGTGTVLVRGAITNQAVNTTREEQGYDDMNGTAGEKQVSANVNLELFSVADVTSPAVGGIQDIKLPEAGTQLQFTIGKVKIADMLNGHISVRRRRNMWFDKQIVDADFTAASVKLEDAGDRTLVTVPMAIANEALTADHTYNIEITVDSGRENGSLNPQVIPKNLQAKAQAKGIRPSSDTGSLVHLDLY